MVRGFVRASWRLEAEALPVILARLDDREHAERFGIRAERVRQLERRALAKLQEAIERAL